MSQAARESRHSIFSLDIAPTREGRWKPELKGLWLTNMMGESPFNTPQQVQWPAPIWESELSYVVRFCLKRKEEEEEERQEDLAMACGTPVL